METETFEEKLIQLNKPVISKLKHEDMLADEIIKAKDKSALSLWWISIPIYLICAFIMKSFFVKDTSFGTMIRELINKQGYVANLIFLVVPVILIISNLVSIKQIYFLSGNPKPIALAKITFLNIIVIGISLLIMTIYLT